MNQLKYFFPFAFAFTGMFYLCDLDHYSIFTFLTGYVALVSLVFWLLQKLPGKIRLAVGASLLLLLLVEVGLRSFMFSTLASHSELGATERIRKYVSIYEQGDNTHLYEGLPNWVYCFTRLEYEHCRDYNEFGIPHNEPIDPQKPNMIFLGDSYTEGHGTPQDSTYVTEMSRLFKNQFNCINAGMGGSDPFYEWKLYEEKLLPLQPRVLVMTISPNDVLDIILRDGDNRFLPGAGYNTGPWWEPFYASSYLVRFVLIKSGYSWFLNSREQQRKKIQHAIDMLRAKLNGIYELSEWRGTEFFVVMHPSLEECRDGQYGFTDFLEVVEDMPPENVINTIEELHGSDCEALYWKADRHFNTKGYFRLANIAYHKMHDPLMVTLNPPPVPEPQ